MLNVGSDLAKGSIFGAFSNCKFKGRPLLTSSHFQALGTWRKAAATLTNAALSAWPRPHWCDVDAAEGSNMQTSSTRFVSCHCFHLWGSTSIRVAGVGYNYAVQAIHQSVVMSIYYYGIGIVMIIKQVVFQWQLYNNNIWSEPQNLAEKYSWNWSGPA